MKKYLQEIFFLGNNYKVAQTLDKIGGLKGIFCEKKAFNINIYNFAKLYSIDFKLVETGKELLEVLPTQKNNSVGISYGIGIIFKKCHIEKFSYGIWNIHPGKLPDNRGRHPISWSFLTNCKKFGLSIHEINEEIDRGNLLAQTTITRDLLDTQLEVEKKIEIELEKGLIKKAITNYFKGKKSEIGLGKYYESLVGKYKNLNIEEFDSKFVFNLFKSQFKYGGVIIKNKTYTECVFYNPNFINFYKNYDIYSCLDGEKVGLK